MEFTLTSGAVLKVTSMPFPDANALRKAILNATKGLKIDENIFRTQLSSIISAVFEAATSDDVERCLFKCFDRALYDDLRVSVSLFDDPQKGEQARRDYHEICMRVIEVNCKPFFESAFSVFKTKLGMISDIPKQA